MSVATHEQLDAVSRRTTGTITLGSAVALALVLSTHPFSSTEEYGDGLQFVEHASPLWVWTHLAAAFVTLAFPLGVAAWGAALSTPSGRVWGRLAGMVAMVGTAIGVLHLIATDTIVPAFFRDTVEEAGPDAVVSADLVMRLHAGTLTAWIVGFWLGVQVTAAIAAWVDGRRNWEVYLPTLGALMLLVSLTITISEGQYTTASDMVFFRIPVVLFLVWLGLVGYEMRRDAGSPREPPAP